MEHHRFQLGSDDYREGAILRLREAQLLRDEQSWVGAISLAGRAVEAILRISNRTLWPRPLACVFTGEAPVPHPVLLELLKSTAVDQGSSAGNRS